MAEIVDIISKLGVDASGVFSEIDKVNSKYKQTNDELKKTETELQRLIDKEAKLLTERQKANNPTLQARYNVEIEKTRKSIELTEKAVKQLTTESNKYEKELSKISKTTKEAFDSTKANSFGKQLLSVAGGVGIATSLTSILSGIKEIGKESFELSARAEGIRTAFSRVGGEETLEKLRKATRGAVSDLDLMEKILRAKNFGIAPELLAKGLEFAGKVARTTGQDINYLSDSFVDGLGRKSIKIIDNLQISGAAVQAELKKGLDFNTAVSNILDKKLAETGVVIDTTADKVSRLSATWSNFKETIGNFLVTTGDGLLDWFKILTGQMTRAELLQKTLFSAAGEGFKKINGAVLDEARESEVKRTALLLQSTERIIDLQNKLTEKGGKKKSMLTFNSIRLELQYEKQLNDDLRRLNQQRTEDFDEGAARRLKKEREFLEQLEIDIRKAQSVFRAQSAQNSDITEVEKIEAKFIELSIQKNIEFEKRAKAIVEEIQSETVREKALVDLKKLEIIELNTLDNQRLADIKASNLRKLALTIESSKSIEELELNIEGALTTLTLEQTDERIGIIIEYTRKKIELMQKEGKDEIEIMKFSLEQALAVENLKRKQLLEIQKQRDAEFEEQERFHLANLEYRKRIHQSQITASEIAFEEQKLQTMKNDYEAQVQLTGKQDQQVLLKIQKQENDIALLKKKRKKEERQEIIDQTIFVIDNINKISEAAINGANQIISAEISKTDKLISLQQKRVDEIEKIAEKGNAELLELEKERLDKLTKEREKYVRQQQVLATIELVANTAVTVSKAAAEGGAAAGFTIAAALIALLAGLASARSIAGQAAFYEGGYTGDGNPREESTAIGRRPYTYHKGEFVHDHKTTKKYRQIFQDVHEGRIDLNKMKFESEMYKMLSANGINNRAETRFINNSGYGGEIMKLKSSMENIEEAIKSQSRLKVNIDERGIAIIATEYIKERKRINTIAR